MPHLTVRKAFEVLDNFHLLAQDIPPLSALQDFDCASLTYNSHDVDDRSLLVCKGAFKNEYVADAVSRGLQWYVAEQAFDEEFSGSAQAIVVTDIRKALAVLAQEFYGHPDKQLTTIGITGTKGKSTTTFFTHAILNDYFHQKVALISSVNNSTDGVHMEESDLTTPESLDLYRMLREAVDNGLTHAVIEVSSQAYKVDRVFNLHFNIGAFLNISPDHISPIEHPSFEDYFACKRRIIFNSDEMVFSADIDYRDVIDADVAQAGIPAHFVDEQSLDRTLIHLDMPGEFNYANAAVAIEIAQLAGVEKDSSSMQAVNHVQVPGRMEIFRGTHEDDGDVIGIVDYAHNAISTEKLLDYVDETYGTQKPYIVLVTGSAGNKAYNRRPEIVHAAENRIQRFIFTLEDTNTEPEAKIAADMDAAITNPDVKHDIILDRTAAIEEALTDAKRQPGLAIVLAIGKGDERWIKMLNKHVPFEGDNEIVRRVLQG